MFNNSIHKNRIKNWPGRVLKDSSTDAVVINRYLAFVTHKYFDAFHQDIPYYKDKEYVIQWSNIKADLLRPFINALRFAERFGVKPEFALQIGAVAYDADSDATQTANSATLTFSHTVATSTNSVLLVGDVSTFYSDGAAATYAGNNLTLEKRLDDGLITAAELYSYVSPTAGANNVILTWGNVAARAGANAISFTSASGVSGMAFSGGSAGSSASTAISSAVGNMVYDILGIAAASTITVGADQTERSNQTHGSSASASSTEAGASSVTMSWSFTLSNYAHIGIDVDAAAIPVNSNFLTFMGPQPQV